MCNSQKGKESRKIKTKEIQEQIKRGGIEVREVNPRDRESKTIRRSQREVKWREEEIQREGWEESSLKGQTDP